MPAAKDIHDPESITAYIQKLEPGFASIIEAVRQVILNTDATIGEQIKWNSPSFFYTGQMKPFDPKTYKRDIVVMNLRKGEILLVFPTGATITDTTGLLEGNYTDGRRMAKFITMDDVQQKGKDLQTVIRAWLELVEK
ncbi:MAG: DUF1801 domain-containing protein [Taibaiella sp.]|jgi:hypothetical protein